jgi:hypothetical protein
MTAYTAKYFRHAKTGEEFRSCRIQELQERETIAIAGQPDVSSVEYCRRFTSTEKKAEAPILLLLNSCNS